MNRNYTEATFPRSVFRCLLAAACGALAAAAHAAVSWHDVHVGGFVSQGYLLTTGNNQYGDTKNSGSPDLRDMALNVSAPLTPHLRVGAQGFAQRLGKYGKDRPILDWAVADYNFSQYFGLRVGRVKLPRGLYNESLDLDATRPFVFLPSSLYEQRLRDFQAAFNGAMAYGSVDTKRLGSFDYKVFYGKTPLKLDSGIADLLTRGDTPLSMNLRAVYGSQVFWTGHIPGLRFGASVLTQNHFQFTEHSETISTRTGLLRIRDNTDVFDNRRYIGSAEYIRGPWTTALEWEHVRTNDQVLPPSTSTNSHLAANLFYLSLARKFGERWEVGSYYSGTRKSRGVSASTSSSGRRLNEYALCVRRDITDHWLVKLEAHWTEGVANIIDVPGSPNPTRAREGRWWLFAAKTTVTF